MRLSWEISCCYLIIFSEYLHTSFVIVSFWCYCVIVVVVEIIWYMTAWWKLINASCWNIGLKRWEAINRFRSFDLQFSSPSKQHTRLCYNWINSKSLKSCLQHSKKSAAKHKHYKIIAINRREKFFVYPTQTYLAHAREEEMILKLISKCFHQLPCNCLNDWSLQ